VPFAHCIECGSSALIDPSGRCPEGHTVGAAGARVAAAIGSARPHPDEPQPWVRQVQLEPGLVDEAPVEPRTARPLSVPSAPEPSPRQDQASTEDLMRELHALGDLGDLADLAGTSTPAAAPAPAAPAPAAPAPATPAPAAPAPAPPTPAATTSPTPAPTSAPAPTSSPAPTSDLGPARPHLVAVPPLEDPALRPAPAPSGVAPAAAEHADLAALTDTGRPEDTRELEPPSTPLFGTAAVSADTPAPPSSPDEATDLASLANLAAAVRSLDDRADEASATPAPDATPVDSAPVRAPLFPPPSSTAPQLPPPSADAATELPVTAELEVPAASVFDGSFTAKGGGRPRRADARPGKRGLFRR
jgi:hypothetical protein